MVRILLVSFFIIVFSVFLGHFTSAKAQETGILSVTTTPVRGDIYVDKIFKGTNYWSGNLRAGSHVVSFGNVDGYIAPPPQTVTIIADQAYYVIGSYRKLFSTLKSVLVSRFQVHFHAPIARIGPWERTAKEIQFLTENRGMGIRKN
jgi:glycine/D-amino acid oxidase-like deaminating enzyme